MDDTNASCYENEKPIIRESHLDTDGAPEECAR